MRVEAIHKDCQQKLASGMLQLHAEAKSIVNDSFDMFYSGGTPIVYQRTDTLRGAEDVQAPSIGGDTATMEAGYDGSKISYPITPSAKFTGPQVFDATATGTYGVVGDPSYDDLALQQIIAAADSIFSGLFG